MITIMIAGFAPIPTKGTEKASSAMQGIDCMILARPMTIRVASLLCVMTMPTGIPIDSEMNTAMVVIFIWSMKSRSSSLCFAASSARKSVNYATPLFGGTLGAELPAQHGEQPSLREKPPQP